jgi:hypothetical protein
MKEEYKEIDDEIGKGNVHEAEKKRLKSKKRGQSKRSQEFMKKDVKWLRQ